MNEKKINYIYTSIGSSVGFASGVVYAFYKKTGFWKGLGIAIIGNVVLGSIGYSIDYAKNIKKLNN
jgi:hypothetical protein